MAAPGIGPMIMAAFADTKEKPLYTSDAWKSALDDSAAWLSEQRGQNKANLIDFETGLAKARGQIEPLAQEDIGTLGGQISRAAGYNPFSGFQQTGNQWMDWGDRIARNMADIGSSRVKLADAGLYGGKGGGSYGTNILLNNISRNLAPVWGNITNQVNNSYLAQQQDREMNQRQLYAAMAARRGIPLETANLALAPIQARQQALMGELGAGNAAATALRNLYRGSEVKKNVAAKLLDQTNASFDTTLNAAVSLAGDAVAAYTGGMAGGGGGGGGGNVAVPAAPSSSYTPSATMGWNPAQAPNWGANPPTVWGAGPPAYYDDPSRGLMTTPDWLTNPPTVGGPAILTAPRPTSIWG